MSATKPKAHLRDIWVPVDLPALFFSPPTPLTQIPLHTGWMLQWAGLVLSLEKFQKPFPFPSVIWIHPNLFWAELGLRRAVFAPQYHKLEVQNPFMPKARVSSVTKQLPHTEPYQVGGPRLTSSGSRAMRRALRVTAIATTTLKAGTRYFPSSLKGTAGKGPWDLLWSTAEVS